jgi:hypothetical protein
MRQQKTYEWGGGKVYNWAYLKMYTLGGISEILTSILECNSHKIKIYVY